eukprot:GGOE01043574.1.p2 GENE.GGOE01043574.1~~GGOE01043574.1.p2  ORF type:complete len:121 (-),score=34.93 GGOE01043574.1:202-564(-)
MLRLPKNDFIVAESPSPTTEWRGVDMQKEERLKLHRLQTNFGWWMPAQYSLEKEMYSNVRRLGGLPSSFLGLETMTGDINTFQWEDYLNDPVMTETVQPPVHSVMEFQVLGHEVAKDRNF